MAFCTLLEWDVDFPLDRYYEMVERTGSHGRLPDGCLCRIVGPVESGARVIEVWQSADAAATFNREEGHHVAEFALPAPSRVTAFETTTFEQQSAGA